MIAAALGLVAVAVALVLQVRRSSLALTLRPRLHHHRTLDSGLRASGRAPYRSRPATQSRSVTPIRRPRSHGCVRLHRLLTPRRSTASRDRDALRRDEARRGPLDLARP